MNKQNIHIGNAPFLGIIAIIAAGVLALMALSFAEEPNTIQQQSPPPQPSESCATGWQLVGDHWECHQVSQQQSGQEGDKCSQIHSYQGGDRCEKERMLLQYGCVPDISPECKGGDSGNQYGPGSQGGGQRMEVGPNGIATCYDEYGRWNQGPDCQKAAGTWHGTGQQGPQQGWQGSGSQGWTPHESAGSGPMPIYQIDRPDHHGGPSQYHGGPDMGRGMMGPGMGGGMMGGPGIGGGMMGGPGCEMFDDVIDEMKSRLEEMNQEATDRWNDMEEGMREKAADKIESLQDRIEDTDDQQKIAKYQKQIAKIKAKIEKQVAKMKARFEKQTAKMKVRMEKELAKLAEKAAECEDRESEMGDSGGGGWDGGDIGTMAPSFGPGGGNPFGY